MSQIREENRNGKGNKLPWDTFLSPASKQYAMRREQQRKAGLTGKIGMRASFKTEVPAEVPSDIDGFKVLPPIAPGNSSRPTTNNDNKLGKTQPTPLPDIKQSSSSSSSQTPTVKSAGGISSKPTTANGFSSSSSKPDTVPTTATSNTTGNTSKPTTASNNKNSYAVNSSKPTTAANNEQTIKKSRPPQWDNIVFVLGGPGSGEYTCIMEFFLY